MEPFGDFVDHVGTKIRTKPRVKRLDYPKLRVPHKMLAAPYHPKLRFIFSG